MYEDRSASARGPITNMSQNLVTDSRIASAHGPSNAAVWTERTIAPPLAHARLKGLPVPGSPDTHPELARRVLVVDDNLVNQLVAVGLLRKRGLGVEGAVNGREALEMHHRSTYDAIFMDCQMPELDGYDTTREIRRREGSDRHTPIIAMTASTMPGDHERCLAAGMDHYTGKPINPAALDYAITRSLGDS